LSAAGSARSRRSSTVASDYNYLFEAIVGGAMLKAKPMASRSMPSATDDKTLLSLGQQ
jgi:hypothetical protein